MAQACSCRGVFIVAAKRTPFGTFGGKLKNFTATELAAIANTGAFQSANLDPKIIDSVVLGNVLQVSYYGKAG